MIDTENGGEFVTYVMVDPYTWDRPETHEWMWKYLKEQLIKKFYDEVFTQFLNGGWYTINLMFVQENIDRHGPYTKLGVIGKIFKVQERTHVVAILDRNDTVDYSLPVLKKEWKILCAGCGNIFTPDMRGGCSACGAPADWIKNWTLEAK